MTRLVTQLILAMLMLPLVGALVLLFFFFWSRRPGPPSASEVVIMWCVVYPFVAVYWLWVWRETVRWTPARRIQTAVWGVVALACSVAIGAFLRATSSITQGDVLGALVGGGFGPIVWVLATILIWRETPQEPIDRLTAAGVDAVCCLICGYNMTGLRESRCPECGAQFPLEQLFAGQSLKDRTTLPDA